MHSNARGREGGGGRQGQEQRHNITSSAPHPELISTSVKPASPFAFAKCCRCRAGHTHEGRRLDAAGGPPGGDGGPSGGGRGGGCARGRGEGSPGVHTHTLLSSALLPVACGTRS